MGQFDLLQTHGSNRSALSSRHMEEDTRKQVQAILEACREAWRELKGPGTPTQRAGRAEACFSACKRGPLSPFVEDVCKHSGVHATEAALRQLESLARDFLQPDA